MQTKKFIEYLEAENKKLSEELKTIPANELPILKTKIDYLGEIIKEFYKCI